MSDRNNNHEVRQTGKDIGAQGVDKAPGEETAQSTSNPVQETQRGKGKVDGDPSQESDQPVQEP